MQVLFLTFSVGVECPPQNGWFHTGVWSLFQVSLVAFTAQTLKSNCLGLDPLCTTYQLCEGRRFLNSPGPQFPHW